MTSMTTTALLHRQHEEDSPTVPFRSGRFFRLANYWFFATREGPAMGPYDALDQAQQGVEAYVEFVGSAPPRVLDTLLRSTAIPR